MQGTIMICILFILNFQLERDTTYLRANAAKQLHKALSEQKAEHGEMYYILKLPHPSQHSNHITGKVLYY